jgi:hypothetical protein
MQLRRFLADLLGVHHRSPHPHAEPACREDLRHSLSFLLGCLASNGDSVNPAYPMLLSEDDGVIRCALRLMEAQGGQWRARQEADPREVRRELLAELERIGVVNRDMDTTASIEPTTVPITLDLEGALRIALLDCEARAHPVTANTLQMVEDIEYPGYWRRARRRMWLKSWTLLAFVVGIWTEAYYLFHADAPDLALGVEEVYAINAVKYFMWGTVGAGLPPDRSRGLLRPYFTEDEVLSLHVWAMAHRRPARQWCGLPWGRRRSTARTWQSASIQVSTFGGGRSTDGRDLRRSDLPKARDGALRGHRPGAGGVGAAAELCTGEGRAPRGRGACRCRAGGAALRLRGRHPRARPPKARRSGSPIIRGAAWRLPVRLHGGDPSAHRSMPAMPAVDGTVHEQWPHDAIPVTVSQHEWR